ncbi:MAG TPA: hypothetical protein VFL91_28140 [Thermomicrobiales bacterium]|nr:hypothetical protein [Thermomicrobiales bacterium]
MQFLVIGRLIDAPVAPPDQEIAMLKATFEQLASGANPQIKAVYPFADERATAFVVDVDAADDLGRLIGSLPASRLSTFVSHPIVSPQSVLEQLSHWEQLMAGR